MLGVYRGAWRGDIRVGGGPPPGVGGRHWAQRRAQKPRTGLRKWGNIYQWGIINREKWEFLVGNHLQ